MSEAPLTAALRWRLKGMQPVLVNRYHRRYFASANGHLRLTLDTGLTFFDARDSAGALRSLAVDAPRLILELKYAPAFAAEAAEAARHLPFRFSRCSKYVQGVEHLPAV